MSRKVQFMALVDELDVDRIDALRIVLNVSRAEINRQALKGGGLGTLEKEHRSRLLRLYDLAGDSGHDEWRAWVRETVRDRKNLPTLEVMEVEAREARERAPAPA